jgi:AcrR family transcriptional regulator
MIDIAERILENEGLMSVQARRVTKEAQCSVGTLYNVFNGLDGLIITVNTKTLKELGDALMTALSERAGAPVGERLLALAMAYLAFAESHPRRWRAVFEHRFMSRAAAETLLGPYREDQNELFRLVECLLEPTIVDAQARAGLAKALFSAVHGIVILALDEKLGTYSKAETEARVRFIVEAAEVKLNSRHS